MKIHTVLLLSSVLSIHAADIDGETGNHRLLDASGGIAIEMSGIQPSRFIGGGEELDLDGFAKEQQENQQMPVLSSLPEVNPVAEASTFNLGDYYDRNAYLSKKVNEMIAVEGRYDRRAKVYNVLGTGAMWVAGFTGFTTTVISGLGGSSIIPPKESAVVTGCLGAFTTFCVWASAQCKKSAGQYDQASVVMQRKLGVPTALIPPKVNIRIDLLGTSDVAGSGIQQVSTASTRERQVQN